MCVPKKEAVDTSPPSGNRPGCVLGGRTGRKPIGIQGPLLNPRLLHLCVREREGEKNGSGRPGHTDKPTGKGDRM